MNYGIKRGLHVQIASDIARKILSGEHEEGEILPTEMVLCEQFGVSRTVLREAVKLLTSKGLVCSRPKIGTRVVERDSWNFLDPQMLEWMSEVSDHTAISLQFLALRRAIEPEACFIAAQNASEQQRAHLTTTFQAMCDAANREPFDQHEWSNVDQQFHQTIFAATGNPFYIAFGNLLNSMFKSFIIHSSSQGDTCLKEHRCIYEAIMEKDPVKAKTCSMEHLKEHKHRLPEPLPGATGKQDHSAA
ncbi:FadR/GntR family transcriptional regulator [Marinomonas algarum]|uniref:FadR family transcriptional regulator n=1 Tax=Marinomonas algarum TaxID=2883105 RepID=A0A9X1INB1_9GAMM|nr:FadR/GntR family transcriptional regulator [Marinomonas algarum]MCB5161176.1 FadR family transcriptional regulator [Marinomonas algarum]